jgi:hypothetical protein
MSLHCVFLFLINQQSYYYWKQLTHLWVYGIVVLWMIVQGLRIRNTRITRIIVLILMSVDEAIYCLLGVMDYPA